MATSEVLKRTKQNKEEIADIYGEYFGKKELAAIKKYDKLEVLCADGLNYFVEVTYIDHEKDRINLHFSHWGTKYDFKGNMSAIFVTKRGTYSEGILRNNTYAITVEGAEGAEDENVKSDSSKQHEFPSGQVYPDGFLSKPKRPSKRKSDDSSAQKTSDYDAEQLESSESAGGIAVERQSRTKKVPKRLISEEYIPPVSLKQQHILLSNIYGAEATEAAPKKTVGVSVGKEELVKTLEQLQDQGVSYGKRLLETTTKSIELVVLLSSSDNSNHVHLKNNLDQIKELLTARKNIDSVIQRLMNAR